MPESRIIVRGLLRLDLRGFAVAVAGRDLELTVTAFLLLEALAQQRYRVLDRAMPASDHVGLTECWPERSTPDRPFADAAGQRARRARWHIDEGDGG